MKKALITGITGQDGSYLTELLLEKGYEVHGVIRRHSTPCTERIDHLLSDAQYDGRIFLHYGDLTDSSNAHALIREIQPDEVYNLAAQSHVAVSFEVPEYTAQRREASMSRRAPGPGHQPGRAAPGPGSHPARGSATSQGPRSHTSAAGQRTPRASARRLIVAIATTDRIVSISDQVLKVCPTVIPKYSLTSQKPASLT